VPVRHEHPSLPYTPWQTQTARGFHLWYRQLTGARVGETLALRWEDVSADGVLTFLYTKTGKIRCVGGTDEVRAVLEALPRVHAHVFASPRTGTAYGADGLRSMLRRAVVRAGIDGRGVSFHTLRHSFATRLVAANVDIKTVSTILGHSTSRMLLERYAHESEARKQAALAAHPGAVGHTGLGGAEGVAAV
jgi:integrase